MATPTYTPSPDVGETLFPTMTPGPIAAAFNNNTYTPIPTPTTNRTPTPPNQPLWQDFLSSLEDASSVNDEAVLNGWYYNGAIGLLMIGVFIIMRPHHVVYSTRLLDPGIRVKPPAIPSTNCQWIWAWIKPVLLVSEAEILETAGLDTLIYLRVVKMGIQFFVPICIAAFLTVVPVHVTSGEWVKHQANFIDGGGNQPFNFSTPFTSISMAQVPAGSNALWLHFVFMHVVVAWGCYLCYRNYQTFVVLRHKYLGEAMSPEDMEERQMVLKKGWPWPRWLKRYCKNLCGGQSDKAGSTTDKSLDASSQHSSSPRGFRTSTRLMGPVQAATVLARSISPKTNFLWRSNSKRQDKKEQQLRTVLEGNAAQGMDFNSAQYQEPFEIMSPHSPLNTPPGEVQEMQRSGSLGQSIAPSIQAKLHKLASRKSIQHRVSAATPPGTPPREVNVMAASVAALSATDSMAGQCPAINVDIAGGAVVGPGMGMVRAWDYSTSQTSSVNGGLSTCGPSESFTAAALEADAQKSSRGKNEAPDSGVQHNLGRKVGFLDEPEKAVPKLSTAPPAALADIADVFKEDDAALEAAPNGPTCFKKSASMPVRAISSSEVAPTATAAVRWWQEFSTTADLAVRTSSNLLGKVRNSGSGISVKGSPSLESAPASAKFGANPLTVEIPTEDNTEEAPGPPAEDAATHVRVVSKPRVLALKTAPTKTVDGEPCRVMAELYAVLVTGVPNLEARRRALDRRLGSKKKPGVFGRVLTHLTTTGSPSSSDNSCAAEGSGAASDVDAYSFQNNSLSFAADEVEDTADSTDRVSQTLQRANTRVDPDEIAIQVQGSGSSHLASHPGMQFGNAVKSNSPTPRLGGLARHVSADEASLSGFVANAKRQGPNLTTEDGSLKVPTDMSAQRLEVESENQREDLGGSRRQTQDFTESGRQFDVVTATFQAMFPNTFFCTIPIHKDRKVEKLLFKWNNLSRQLDVAQEKKRLWGYTPTIRINSHCCMGGEVMDAEEYYRKEVANVEEEMLKARAAAWEAEPTGNAFVLFFDQFSATVAAQSVINPEDGSVFNTQPAPGPDNINWTTLWRTPQNQLLRKILATPALMLIILFPAGFFSASITQLDVAFCASAGASVYCGTEGDYKNAGSVLHQLLQSPLLPSLLLTIWQMVAMPHTLYSLSLVQADSVAKSSLDHKIAKYFFLWGLFNVFLGGMLGGMSELLSLIIEPTNFLLTVGNSMIKAANFFIQFVQFQTLIIAVMGLMQPHGGIWMYLFARIFHRRTGGCCLLERDVAMTWTAKSLRYGREIPIHLLIFLLGLCYSAASPGILPYCAMYFIIFYFVRRYHALYVFERCYESGGLFWPLVFDMVMIMLFTFQVFMAAVLITFQASIQAGISFVTIPVSLFYFRQYCHKRFTTASKYLPLETACRAPPALVDPAMYVPIPLRNGAAGWHPECRKTWNGYGMIAATV